MLSSSILTGSFAFAYDLSPPGSAIMTGPNARLRVDAAIDGAIVLFRRT
jgi:hypothetical protein